MQSLGINVLCVVAAASRNGPTEIETPPLLFGSPIPIRVTSTPFAALCDYDHVLDRWFVIIRR